LELGRGGSGHIKLVSSAVPSSQVFACSGLFHFNLNREQQGLSGSSLSESNTCGERNQTDSIDREEDSPGCATSLRIMTDSTPEGHTGDEPVDRCQGCDQDSKDGELGIEALGDVRESTPEKEN
jgi:hypothetical protein